MLGFDGPEVDLDALVKVLQSEGEALDGREAAFFVNQVGGGTVPVGAVSGALTAFDTVVEAAERSEGDDDELAAPSATSGVSAVSMEAVPILPRNDSAGILSRSLGSIESGTDATFFPFLYVFHSHQTKAQRGKGVGSGGTALALMLHPRASWQPVFGVVAQSDCVRCHGLICHTSSPLPPQSRRFR